MVAQIKLLTAQLLKMLSIQYLSVPAFSVFKIPALSDSHLGEGEGGKKIIM